MTKYDLDNHLNTITEIVRTHKGKGETMYVSLSFVLQEILEQEARSMGYQVQKRKTFSTKRPLYYLTRECD